MSDALTIKYTPETNDYAQVVRIFFLKQTGIRISLGFLAIAFIYILFIVATQSTPVSLFEILWLLAPPLFVGYILILQPRSVARRAMSSERLSSEQTWVLNDEGVQIQPTFGDELLAWDKLAKLVTSKEYYVLIFKTEKNVPFFIPLRAFTSPAEQDQFIGMVKSHLPH